MEKIKQYNLEELSQSRKGLNRYKQKWGRSALHRFTLDDARVYLKSKDVDPCLDLADAMYAGNKEWVDGKFEPLLPYLQKATEKTQDTTKATVAKYYKEGLTVFSALLDWTEQDFEPQDIIASYTIGFVTTLRICERLDMDPTTALQFAEKAFHTRGREIVQLFEEYPNISEHVIKRAAGSSDPAWVLQDYGKWDAQAKRLLLTEQYSDASYEEAARAAARRRLGYERRNGDIFDQYDSYKSSNALIEEVPRLLQKHGNWCGVTSTAMVLQRWGYNVTPEDIFRKTNGEYDPILEHVEPDAGPTADTLALAVQELTPLNVRVLVEKNYEQIRKKNPSLATPRDVLQYYLRGGIPCIVRTPGHFKVLIGMDEENDKYLFNDPLSGFISVNSTEFEREWQSQPYLYPPGSSYLMMAIYPQRKKAQ